MEKPACPLCTMTDLVVKGAHHECLTCGHEWDATPAAEASGPRVIKDAHGTALADGDTVILIKDLKLRGSSQVLKQGIKGKNIRLDYDSDHEISCKVDGASMALKACFVKKA